MSSAYADEGTVAHALAAMALTEGRPASAYINRVITCDDYPHAKLSPSTAHRWMRCAGSHALEARIEFKPRRFSMTVTHEMAEGVQIYLDNLAKYRTEGSELLVEQKLPIGHLTGEEGATGTGDGIILDFANAELQVHDLKFGRGVEVSAVDNEQLRMYLLGALENYGLLAEWKSFRGVIHQPRISGVPSEERWTLEELQAFAGRCRERAYHATQVRTGEHPNAIIHHLTPGDKQCQFCDAKAKCPAVEKLVRDSVMVEFEDLDKVEAKTLTPNIELTRLAKLYAIKDLVIDWAKAIAAEFESRLLAGEQHPDWKLVTGRKGNRAWRDATEAETVLKSMRLKHDEMYEYSLISPTSAEKLAKAGTLGERQWKKLQEHITQTDGKVTVAPASDKRAAIEVKPVAEEFPNLEEEQLV